MCEGLNAMREALQRPVYHCTGLCLVGQQVRFDFHSLPHALVHCSSVVG